MYTVKKHSQWTNSEKNIHITSKNISIAKRWYHKKHSSIAEQWSHFWPRLVAKRDGYIEYWVQDEYLTFVLRNHGSVCMFGQSSPSNVSFTSGRCRWICLWPLVWPPLPSGFFGLRMRNKHVIVCGVICHNHAFLYRRQWIILKRQHSDSINPRFKPLSLSFFLTSHVESRADYAFRAHKDIDSSFIRRWCCCSINFHSLSG